MSRKKIESSFCSCGKKYKKTLPSFYRDNYVQNGCTLLQQNTLINLTATMQQIHFPVNAEAKSFYAAGWFQTGLMHEILFHSGSTCGFNNYVIEAPDQKLSIVYFSNLADNSASFKAILQVIKDINLGDFLKCIFFV